MSIHQFILLPLRSTTLLLVYLGMGTWTTAQFPYRWPGQAHDSVSMLLQLFKIPMLKTLADPFYGQGKPSLLEWKGGSIDLNGQFVSGLAGNMGSFIEDQRLLGDWSLLGMPVEMGLLRQDINGPGAYSRNQFYFRFQQEAYLNAIRNRIHNVFSSVSQLPDYRQVLMKLKITAENRLKTALIQISAQSMVLMDTALKKLVAQAILAPTTGFFRDTLLSEGLLKSIEHKKHTLVQLQKQDKDGLVVNMPLYDSLQQSVAAMTALVQMINTINLYTTRERDSGFLQSTGKKMPVKEFNLQQCMREPAQLKRMASESLDLNGIQKFFLNISQLSVGQNTVQLSPLTIYQYTNNGINLSFFNRNRFLFIMAAKQPIFFEAFNNDFPSRLLNSNQTSLGIRMGKGDLAKQHMHLSFFSYQQRPGGNFYAPLNINPGRTRVITVSTQLPLNQYGSIRFELSRSAHTYNDHLNEYDSSLRVPLISSSSGTTGFLSQMAFHFQWDAENPEKGWRYNLHGSGTGKAYANPGNLLLRSGNASLSGSFAKRFFQNRLQLTARGNCRNYEYSVSRWFNYDFSIQGKWKSKKGQFISMQYQPYRSFRVQQSQKQAIGKTYRLSVDGQFRKRIKGIYYQHMVSLSVSGNRYAAETGPVGQRAVLISSAQSITINRKSYCLNMQYNSMNGLSSTVFLAPQFNMDAGFTYNVFRAVTASTAISYSCLTQWFNQLGIKQTISGKIGKKCSINLYADIRKHCKIILPVMSEASRIEWNLQYNIP